jgi:dihydrofolate synthase / folylpolyglutamate synthase
VDTSYSKAIDWLFGTQIIGVKLGLENIRRLLDRLGNPEKELRFIHVVGTNGKGSVCAMIDSILRQAGYRTGLFTSPHLVRFNERIQVNGFPIDDQSVVNGIERVRAQIQEEGHPTFFEITTAVAFDYFRTCKVDIVILETGLGGRLDATNVVNPLVSVVTSIDLDHQKWLGNSLSEIAFEKAGIIKPGVPVVSCGQLPEVRAVIEKVAKENGSLLEYIYSPIEKVPVGLQGSHQRVNAALAVAALKGARLMVSQGSVNTGLKNVKWPGRFQEVNDRIVLDGAHNASASRRLVQTWRERFGNERPSIVFGGMRDKDLSLMASELGSVAQQFFLVPVNSVRAASPLAMRDMLPPQAIFTLCNSVDEALALTARMDSRILVTGSLFLVGQVLALLQPASGRLQPSAQ